MLIIIFINLIGLGLERIILQRRIVSFFIEKDKNFIILRLSESETKTTMHVFSDHSGVIIDPYGAGFANQNTNRATAIPDMHGVRISPRQSPVYQPMVNMIL
jgi:hypothetical protein